MDTATFLTIVIILIALILSAVGAYLILILHEARHSLKRINRILDRFDNLATFIDEKIARPGANIASIFGVLKEFLDFFQNLKKTVKKNSEQEEKQNG